ncbi:MAG TPA: MFS transporter [Ilumatobacteraceae bacterium]|nr:MFS transporter [Ilumatobacteraceae bacterium]
MSTEAQAAIERDTRRLGPSYHKLFISTVISNVGDGMSIIAYPWLASAITRNPLLITSVALVQRLPWLVFTLPAGVITDRVDRKRAMVVADFTRFVLTLFVALAVLGRQSHLPGPNDLTSVHGTQTGLYLVLLAATLLLGTAEVLRDNCGQTFMPSIVHPDQLEKANGRMWSAEGIANTFVGPPLGSLLLLAAFSLPFFVDAASFFAAAALVALIPGSFRAHRPVDHVQAPWRRELAEGFRWLWANDLLRSMAIILGLMNLASMLSGSVLVLFAQEVLDIGPFLFTIMSFGLAAGAAVGANTAPWLSKKLGSGTCLALTLGSSAAVSFVVGLSSWWPIVMIAFAVGSMLGASWNVITVSLRQTIIPPHLLGRVNSVYRFFAWGMMPIGAALGGATVTVVSEIADRRIALRSAFFFDAAIYACLFVIGRSRLTTAKLEAARAAATA